MDAIGKNAGAPLFGLAAPLSDGGFGSVALRRIVELVVVLDMTAVLIGCAVAASRGLFAMARDHRLPRPLGRVSRRGTPLVASGVVVAFCALTIVLTHAWSGLFAQPGLPHYVAIFSWGSTFGSFALATIYLLLSIGAVRGLRAHADSWKVWLAGTVGIVVTAAAIFGSVYKVAAPIIWAPWAAIGVLVVGLALTFVLRGKVSVPTDFSALPDAEAGPVKL
jgi:amino acid transporter